VAAVLKSFEETEKRECKQEIKAMTVAVLERALRGKV
jgi:hypothetical protein